MRERISLPEAPAKNFFRYPSHLQRTGELLAKLAIWAVAGKLKR
jgi:hypothetical protein